jgi:acyl carrier protein
MSERMMDKSLPQTIRRIMADVFRLPLGAIGDDAAMGVLDQWDSGNHVSLVMALEEEFGFSLDVSEIERMTSFPAVLSVVEQKL